MAIRLRIWDYDLEGNWAVVSTHVVGPSTTKFRLPHCLSKSNEIIDDYWIRSNRQLKCARINVNYREALGILVDSFEGKLGLRAFDSAKVINE